MKFGVREICDVVLKAKSAQKIGNKVFYAGEPVIYFDTLKTSSLEGAATTVYAQGGRGNSRLVAWEGERTLTFTMEDALISPEGFMILSGAGLIAANNDKPIYQHITETIDASDSLRFKFDATGFKFAVYTENKPYLPANIGDNFAYVMFMKNGEITTEPYIPVHEGDDTAIDSEAMPETVTDLDGKTYYRVAVMDHKMYVGLASYEDEKNQAHKYESESGDTAYDVVTLPDRLKFDSVLVDYYTERKSGATQMEITADKFGGNYYLEASTLFRDTNGVDMPAEFIIPNCKIQSNFTFSMAATGDPSTFTFTLDAFPGTTRFNPTKKVLAAIQIIEEITDASMYRTQTIHDSKHDSYFDI